MLYNAYQLILYICQTRLVLQHFEIHYTLWLALHDVPMLCTLSAREYFCGIVIVEDGLAVSL